MPTILWLVNSHPCPVLPCRSGFLWYGQRRSQHPSVVPGSQTFPLHEAGCRWVGQEGVCPPCVPCGLQGQKTAVPGRVRLLFAAVGFPEMVTASWSSLRWVAKATVSEG